MQVFWGEQCNFMVIQGISDSSCDKFRIIIRIMLATGMLFYLWMWYVHYLYNNTYLFKLTSTDHWIIRKEGKSQHIDEKFLLFFYVVSIFILAKLWKFIVIGAVHSYIQYGYVYWRGCLNCLPQIKVVVVAG